MLVTLSDQQIALALRKLARHLPRYLWLQEQVAAFESVQTNERFKREFGSFYGFRTRDAAWRDCYFDLMDELKGGSFDFPDCLNRLYRGTNRVEASFASKMLATLDPHRPVIDSVVLRHTGLKLRYWGSVDRRIRLACEAYFDLNERLNSFLNSSAGTSLISAFRNHSAEFSTAPITDMKILDLLLWQSRNAKCVGT